jgi:hypothetical protein
MQPMKLWALAAAVVLLPQEDDRAKLERLIIMRGCPPSEQERKEIVALAQAGLELLPGMIEGGGQLMKVRLYWYGHFAELKRPARTPAVILNLARSGSDAHHWRAAAIALKIMDDRALEFLLDGLKRLAAGESTETGNLEGILLERAGWSHSEEAGKLLLAMLEKWSGYRKIQIVDALGHLGYAPAVDALKKLGDEKVPMPGRAKGAIEKIEYLASTECARKLVDRLRMPKQDFPWRDWALDEILHRKLSEAADGIRRQYDDLVKAGGPPRDGNDWRAKLLHGIHKLGGRLAPQELALLKDLGRLPPAEPVKADAVELKRGFAEGIWVPHADRLKAAEEKRAPPARIPEEKLPRIMKDRIRFVLDLIPPDPSYLAPHAALALETLEEMLGTPGEPTDVGKLLETYRYLAGLRDGMKSPDIILDAARKGNLDALRAATVIADDRAESLFLEAMKGPHRASVAISSGRLSSPAVKGALLKYYQEVQPFYHPDLLTPLADLGCTEIVPDLKKARANAPGVHLALWKLEILAAPDRDARLLSLAKSGARSTDFSYAYWARDQIVRLDLREMGPDLRKWFDEVHAKWVPSHRPDRQLVEIILALSKLGMPITSEEEQILKQNGRRP